MEKKTWIKTFLALGFGWIAMELVAVFDSNDNTVPLTTLIIDYIPAWLGLPAIGFFCIWLFTHFLKWYKVKNKKK